MNIMTLIHCFQTSLFHCANIMWQWFHVMLQKMDVEVFIHAHIDRLMKLRTRKPSMLLIHSNLQCLRFKRQKTKNKKKIAYDRCAWQKLIDNLVKFRVKLESNKSNSNLIIMRFMTRARAYLSWLEFKLEKVARRVQARYISSRARVIKNSVVKQNYIHTIL